VVIWSRVPGRVSPGAALAADSIAGPRAVWGESIQLGMAGAAGSSEVIGVSEEVQ
jgi:hypothetical protein